MRRELELYILPTLVWRGQFVQDVIDHPGQGGRFSSYDGRGFLISREAAPHFCISSFETNEIISAIPINVRTVFGEILREQDANKMLIELACECLKMQAGLIAQ